MGKENSKAIPTQEEYIAEQIEAKKQEALNRSRTRTHPRVPMSGTRMSKKEWEQDLNNREDRVREELQKGFITPFLRNQLTNELRTIAIERGMGYDAYRGTGEPLGSSCTATAFDNYGMDIVSSELFRQNHKEHGFKQVDNTDVQPSDIVIDVENGKGSHTLMLDSGTVKENNLRFNASNGGFEPQNLRKNARYPFKGSMESYTYTGTPADSVQWINQYKQIYGMAKGGVFGIPKYQGGTPEGGVQQSSTWTSEYISPFGNKKVRPIKEQEELIIKKRQREGAKRFDKGMQIGFGVARLLPQTRAAMTGLDLIIGVNEMMKDKAAQDSDKVINVPLETLSGVGQIYDNVGKEEIKGANLGRSTRYRGFDRKYHTKPMTKLGGWGWRVFGNILALPDLIMDSKDLINTIRE